MLGTYGATEFAGAIAGWTLKDKKQWGPRKRGSVGRAHHGIELRIVDPDTGDVLPAGQTGLLEARGRQLPAADGAWLRTTDLATIDDDRFLFIRGRADDAINRGGFKIPPSVIEDALAAHPAVDEASAVALPDARLGQVPAAAVTLLSPATEEELMRVPGQQADQVPAAGRDQGGGPAAADAVAQDQPRAGPRALLRRFHSPHGAADFPAPRRQESLMTADRAGYGVLTDESFERSRQRIGIPLRINPAHITEVTADATRHFAYGYGDDNPLYCDPAYGKNTRWGGLIAPPNFIYCMGENAAPPPTPEQKELLKGDPFAGLGSYQAVMEFEYYRPLTAGDRCHVIRAQVGVADKPSRFGGRTAHVTHDFLYANGHGQIVTVQRGTWINAERHASKERARETGSRSPSTRTPTTSWPRSTPPTTPRPAAARSPGTSRTSRSASRSSRGSRARWWSPTWWSGTWAGACS